MFDRFFGWLCRRLRINELNALVEDVDFQTAARNREVDKQQEAMQSQLDLILIAVADLREKLNLDPMSELHKEVADLRTSGDPMLGSF